MLSIFRFKVVYVWRPLKEFFKVEGSVAGMLTHQAARFTGTCFHHSKSPASI